MSYVNLIMYGAVIPSYKGSDKKNGSKAIDEEQEVIQMDDPRNKERIKQIFETFD